MTLALSLLGGCSSGSDDGAGGAAGQAGQATQGEGGAGARGGTAGAGTSGGGSVQPGGSAGAGATTVAGTTGNAGMPTLAGASGASSAGVGGGPGDAGNAGLAGGGGLGGLPGVAGSGGAASGAAGLGGAGGRGGAAGSSGGGPSANPLVDRNEVLRTMRLVADYYLNSFGTSYDNSWIRSTFYAGLLAAYRTTQDQKYLTAAETWGERLGWRQPTDASIDSNGQPRHADNQACFQSYAEMYLLDPSSANEVMLTTATSVFDTMVASPNNGEWTWCDALFMAPPAMARVAAAKSKPAYVSLMHTMWWTTHRNLYNPNVGLFWRDNRAKTETSNTYWSRGNGWVIAGTARVLEYLPATDARRSEYEALLLQMANALRPLQNSNDGFWRSDLTNPNAFPNPESSGTAFFCYGIAWGIHHGILDRATFQPVVLKAWNGLVGTALTAEGKVGWVQTVARAPGAAQREDTRDYAGGAFLLAASEIIQL